MSFHVKAVYDRAAVGGTEDVAVTTHDFGRSGELTDAMADAVRDAFFTFMTSIAQVIANNVSVRELRFYDGYNGDGSPGQVDKIRPMSIAGGNTSSMLPPQVACSVTERTDLRKHWGRFYLPGIASSRLTDDGRLGGSAVVEVADAAQALYNAWGTADYQPIVFANVVGAPGNPQQFEVRQVTVDNILDIIRRRRWDTATQREVRSVTDPTP